jgi:hypothetical protein
MPAASMRVTARRASCAACRRSTCPAHHDPLRVVSPPPAAAAADDSDGVAGRDRCRPRCRVRARPAARPQRAGPRAVAGDRCARCGPPRAVCSYAGCTHSLAATGPVPAVGTARPVAGRCEERRIDGMAAANGAMHGCWKPPSAQPSSAPSSILRLCTPVQVAHASMEHRKMQAQGYLTNLTGTLRSF